MIEKSKIGGLTFVGSKRYAKANNKHMGEIQHKTKESAYISYVGANNPKPKRFGLGKAAPKRSGAASLKQF